MDLTFEDASKSYEFFTIVCLFTCHVIQQYRIIKSNKTLGEAESINVTNLLYYEVKSTLNKHHLEFQV